MANLFVFWLCYSATLFFAEQVLVYEVVVQLLMEKRGISYKEANAMCQETEFDPKEITRKTKK